MLIVVLLLVGVPIAPVLSYVLPPTQRCQAFRHWHVTASSIVYCDAHMKEVARDVTLMYADSNPDDVAESDEDLPDFTPILHVPGDRFAVGGAQTDWFGGDVPEPHLLVNGVCIVENYNGVEERKHIEEKVGLPCLFACNQDRIDVRGMGILLDGVSDSEIC